MFWEWTWNCIKLWTLSKCSFKDFLLEKTWSENPPKLFLELSAMTSCISVEGSDSEVFTDAPEVDETTKRRNFQTKTKTVAVNQCSGNPQELKEAIKRGDVERLGLLLKEDVGMLELNENITAMKWVFEIKMRSFQISCFLAWRGLLETHAMNHRFFIFRHPCPKVVIAVYLQDSDWCTRCWSESSALLCQWHHSVSQRDRKGPLHFCWSVKWWFSAIQVALKRLKLC